jgi:hypothetical protein
MALTKPMTVDRNAAQVWKARVPSEIRPAVVVTTILATARRSRIEHCGIDLTKIFPHNPHRDHTLVDGWNWDLYLKTAEQLFRGRFS